MQVTLSFPSETDFDSVIDDLDGRWCNYRDDAEDGTPEAQAIDQAWTVLSDVAPAAFPCTMTVELDAAAAAELETTFENCRDWNAAFSATMR